MPPSSKKVAVFSFEPFITSAVLNKETCYPLSMENELSYCDYLLCDADFQPLKILVICGWGVGSGQDSHGESLAVVPALACMEVWVGASKALQCFLVVYQQPLKRFFSVLEEEGRDQIQQEQYLFPLTANTAKESCFQNTCVLQASDSLAHTSNQGPLDQVHELRLSLEVPQLWVNGEQILGTQSSSSGWYLDTDLSKIFLDSFCLCTQQKFN